jgi:hypothetical protein
MPNELIAYLVTFGVTAVISSFAGFWLTIAIVASLVAYEFFQGAWPVIIPAFLLSPAVIAGAAVGTIPRQQFWGEPLTGPRLNPIWHGALAGVIAGLVFAKLATMVMVSWKFGGAASTTLFSFKAVPPLGLPAVLQFALLSAATGVFLTFLFGRLMGAARWVAWTLGVIIILQARDWALSQSYQFHYEYLLLTVPRDLAFGLSMMALLRLLEPSEPTYAPRRFQQISTRGGRWD